MVILDTTLILLDAKADLTTCSYSNTKRKSKAVCSFRKNIFEFIGLLFSRKTKGILEDHNALLKNNDGCISINIVC